MLTAAAGQGNSRRQAGHIPKYFQLPLILELPEAKPDQVREPVIEVSESKDSTKVFELESVCCMLGWDALTFPGCASQACTARLAQAGV